MPRARVLADAPNLQMAAAVHVALAFLTPFFRRTPRRRRLTVVRAARPWLRRGRAFRTLDKFALGRSSKNAGPQASASLAVRRTCDDREAFRWCYFYRKYNCRRARSCTLARSSAAPPLDQDLHVIEPPPVHRLRALFRRFHGLKRHSNTPFEVLRRRRDHMEDGTIVQHSFLISCSKLIQEDAARLDATCATSYKCLSNVASCPGQS